MIKIQIAKTLQLTAKQFAICQWLSAIMQLANVNNVTQQKTRTALKLKELVEKNASHQCRKLSVTIALENALNARMDKDVLRNQLVILLARRYHQMKLMPVTGLNNHQPVSKIQREPLTRNHVLTNAKLHHMESVTSRLVNVLNANRVLLIQNAPKLWMYANFPTSKSISAKLRNLMASIE
jgi:hypothetical protein